MLKTLAFITQHPLTRERPLAAIARFVRWQLESRIRNEVTFDWIEGAKLVVRNGMTGATGNIYCGLHEFSDMAFVLHLLRPSDLFVDVGANIGSYTILASAVCGAETISIEPDPGTMLALERNVDANLIRDRVTMIEAAVGAEEGSARFTVGRDTTNKMASLADTETREVRVTRLDSLLAGQCPTMIKLDVEGFEAEVLAGATRALRSSSLLALETECRSPAVVAELVSAGFAEVGYEPRSRAISRMPQASPLKSNNALYVRESSLPQVLERLRTAPARRVLGVSL